MGRIKISKFKVIYNFVTHLLFAIATIFKIYGYNYGLHGKTGALAFSRTKTLNTFHPINISANLYGVACCMAFFR